MSAPEPDSPRRSTGSQTGSFTLVVRNLVLPLDAGLSTGEALVRAALARKLGVAAQDVTSFQLLRRSVDARKRNDVHFVASVAVTLSGNSEAFLARHASSDIVAYEPPCFPPLLHLSQAPRVRPVVVGAGPAGLFAALTLAKAGVCPVLIERGSEVERRAACVARFKNGHPLDPETNIQFGEGGAGAFSDGKLTTGTHDSRAALVLATFAEAGAPSEILWQAKPHIGSNRLPAVVRSLREQIVALGGTVHFDTRLVGLKCNKGCVRGVLLSNGEQLETQVVILATGHSARDVFEMLHKEGIALEPKAFSMGVRIEHLQETINAACFGKAASHPALGAADYKLACHLDAANLANLPAPAPLTPALATSCNGRGVYTFCMCPGGEVLTAASEEGCQVTNGASNFERDASNANAGFLVSVTPRDFGSDGGVLAGIEFQREWERRAFTVGGDYRAPAQLLGDFMRARPSTGPSSGPKSVHSSYTRGLTWCSLDTCLPPYVVASLRAAVPLFDRKLHGFNTPEAVLTGIESRSSSPVRIIRDALCQASVAGLYPCGEGAGYAGGIVSAAVDGIRVASQVLEQVYSAQ